MASLVVCSVKPAVSALLEARRGELGVNAGRRGKMNGTTYFLDIEARADVHDDFLLVGQLAGHVEGRRQRDQDLGFYLSIVRVSRGCPSG